MGVIGTWAKPKLPLTSILTLLHLLPANNVALTIFEELCLLEFIELSVLPT